MGILNTMNKERSTNYKINREIYTLTAAIEDAQKRIASNPDDPRYVEFQQSKINQWTADKEKYERMLLGK
jgi:hypothetical protein